MKHDTFKEWLVLSVYGELRDEQKSSLEEHLRACPECRREEAEIRNIRSLAASVGPVEVSDDRLARARRSAREAIRNRSSKGRISDRVTALVDQLFPIVLKPAIVSISMLVVGVGIGHMLFAPGSSAPMSQSDAAWIEAAEKGETFITSVRFVDSDPQDGEIEFTFDALTPVRIRGNVQDQRIQRVLAQALLHEHNPGVRIRAVGAIAQSAPKQADPGVKQALFEVLRTDENAGVRKAALMVLRALPFDGEIRDALIRVLLNDSNDGIRIEAVAYLGELEKQQLEFSREFRQALEQKMLEEKNDYIRNHTLTLIQEVREQ